MRTPQARKTPLAPPTPAPPLQFKRGPNLVGVSCSMHDHRTEYIVIAPTLEALVQVMQELVPGLVLDESKCRRVKLAPPDPEEE